MPAQKRPGVASVSETYVPSPIGCLRITASDAGIQAIEFCENPGPEPREIAPCLHLASRQLEEYFQGRRWEFDLPLDLQGTAFQKKVWAALCGIPCGRTASYGDIARAIGRPGSGRAVGGANHRNPVAIVIPCHRVIGSDGGLTGYGGGLWRKQWLLEHERKSPAGR